MFKLVLEMQRNQDQIANIHWIIEKAREFQKNVYFFFIDYAKASDCVDHNKLGNIFTTKYQYYIFQLYNSNLFYFLCILII